VQYLPQATQGVIVQPLGNAGVLVIGTDTLRGLSRLDQVCSDKWNFGCVSWCVWGVCGTWGHRINGCWRASACVLCTALQQAPL
jgi:hypothetical protein